MFPESTQALYWMFENQTVVEEIRAKTNRKYIENHRGDLEDVSKFLTQEEEWDVVFYFLVNLGDFCRKFVPPMPRYVVGTSFHYFKRFYLNNSVMDHHPREILVTAVYLACKTEEFNVSMQQFVSNVSGNQERATKIILNNELLLMQELQFHLTIHNPFRAVEGLLIDIKTRSEGAVSSEVDSFRPEIDDFLDSVFLTDACLIYAPSQIALAAVIHAASKKKQNFDSYVTERLFGGQGTEAITHIITIVRNIRVMVKNVPSATPNIKILCTKLNECRNQENDPDSQAYKRKIESLVDEDEMVAEMGSKGKKAKLDTSDLMDDGGGIRVLSPPVP